jgi:hypothetical protein
MMTNRIKRVIEQGPLALIQELRYQCYRDHPKGNVISTKNLRLGWCILNHVEYAVENMTLEYVRKMNDTRGRSLATQSTRIARYLKTHKDNSSSNHVETQDITTTEEL